MECKGIFFSVVLSMNSLVRSCPTLITLMWLFLLFTLKQKHLHELHEHTRSLCLQLIESKDIKVNKISFTHISRDFNAEADAAANRAIDEKCNA